MRGGNHWKVSGEVPERGNDPAQLPEERQEKVLEESQPFPRAVAQG